MCDPRITELVGEIRDLYATTCAHAERMQSIHNAEVQELKDRCRAPQSAAMPELQHFETVFDYEDALKKARQDPRIRRRTKWIMGSIWVAVVAANLLVVGCTRSLLAATLAAVLVGFGLFMVTQRLFLQVPLQRQLREQLIERGVPICLACGYDLRGQVTPRCPECGTSFIPPAA